MQTTKRSEKGPGFRAANRPEIKRHGQRTIRGVMDQFNPMSIVAQAADVQTMLGSVNDAQGGHRGALRTRELLSAALGEREIKAHRGEGGNL